MRPAGTLDELLADPFGRYLSGRTFVYFYPAKDLNGFLAWGRPDEDDVRRLTHALDAAFHPDAEPHLSYIDLRRVEGVDIAAFGVLAEYLRRTGPMFANRVKKQALLRPEGFSGAVVAGFFGVVQPTYPVSVFSNPDEALAWLGPPTQGLLAELDALYAEANGAPPVVRALREVLATRLVKVDLARAARAIGVSERTLQRRLQEAGTSFQAEYNAAQIRFAQRLLMDSEMMLTSVALDVGCASLQHFSALFRKHTGVSPSEWRARHRERKAGSQ